MSNQQGVYTSIIERLRLEIVELTNQRNHWQDQAGQFATDEFAATTDLICVHADNLALVVDNKNLRDTLGYIRHRLSDIVDIRLIDDVLCKSADIDTQRDTVEFVQSKVNN